MSKYLKELVLIVLLVLPYLYLAILWDSLPEKVPTHFNIEGTADNWSSKSFLLIIPAGSGLFVFGLLLLIPLIDPKKKIQLMGENYYRLRFTLIFCVSVLSMYLLYITKEGSLKKPGVLISILGIFFAMLGNYFQTIRPNYFIGIRTPWTLENENVWRRTHHLAGQLWMAGGLIIAIAGFFIASSKVLIAVFIFFVFLMVAVPIIYSYREFKKSNSVNQI